MTENLFLFNFFYLLFSWKLTENLKFFAEKPNSTRDIRQFYGLQIDEYL